MVAIMAHRNGGHLVSQWIERVSTKCNVWLGLVVCGFDSDTYSNQNTEDLKMCTQEHNTHAQRRQYHL